MIINEILARNARMYENEISLVERDEVNATRRNITWKEFDTMSSRIANALISKGVRLPKTRARDFLIVLASMGYVEITRKKKGGPFEVRPAKKMGE